MSKNENILIRKMLAQLIDKLYYCPENASRCHKQVYRRLGRFLCQVNYDTYMDYLKEPIPEEAFKLVPIYFVDFLENMVRDLLSPSAETRIKRGRRHPSRKTNLRMVVAKANRDRSAKR